MKLETVLYILPFSFLSDQQQVFENWASGTEKGREELTGPKEMGITPRKVYVNTMLEISHRPCQGLHYEIGRLSIQIP